MKPKISRVHRIDDEIFLPMLLRARESSAISEVGAAHWFNVTKPEKVVFLLPIDNIFAQCFQLKINI